MKSKLFEGYFSRYWVILKTGEDINTTLKKFAEENKLKGGTVAGIGTLKDPEFGFFDLARKEYVKKTLRGEFELISCSGNVSVIDEDTMVHLHAVIADRDFKTYAGHLFKGTVTGTGEFVIDTLNKKIERRYNEKLNLNLIDF